MVVLEQESWIFGAFYYREDTLQVVVALEFRVKDFHTYDATVTEEVD